MLFVGNDTNNLIIRGRRIDGIYPATQIEMKTQKHQRIKFQAHFKA